MFSHYRRKRRELIELLPLLEEEINLSNTLGMGQCQLNPDIVPTAIQRKELIASISMLQEETIKQTDAYKIIKSGIVDFMIKLDITVAEIH